ncbi:MAG TPA: TonB family protein [Thermoanaerobaculia bacterium]|nr:TonB family protein [Thermoanaerobaculia bacterium]
MDDKKPCVRCDRKIDPYARICPYCNHDQIAPPPSPQQQSAEAVAASAGYVPPAERNWRRHMIMIGGSVLLLVASFVVGTIINRDDAPKNAPKPVTGTTGEENRVPRARRSDLTLVPVSDQAAFEQPITSAPIPNPAEGVPTEYQRSDATAVSSVEYATLAQRAQAERRAEQELVDPRSITTPSYAQQRRPPAAQAPQTARAETEPGEPEGAPPPMTSAARERGLEADSSRARRPGASDEPARVVRFTRPVPEHQPLPRINVSQPVTARLQLTIGADGRVKQIHLKNSVPGHTPELITAVQRWRFKPATENGVPVAAPFTVDISFAPDE